MYVSPPIHTTFLASKQLCEVLGRMLYSSAFRCSWALSPCWVIARPYFGLLHTADGVSELFSTLDPAPVLVCAGAHGSLLTPFPARLPDPWVAEVEDRYGYGLCLLYTSPSPRD